MLQTVGRGSPWWDPPAHFGTWNNQFCRFRSWAARGVFEPLLKAAVVMPIWRMCPSTAPLSRSISKPLASKGNSASGHWPLPRRSDNNNRATGGQVRPSHWLPPVSRAGAGQQRGVAPPIHSLSFGALLADPALDSNWLVTELDVGKVTGKGQPQETEGSGQGNGQVAASDCKLLCQDQGGWGIAIRYDKTDNRDAATWNLVATLIPSR